jgi:transcriptional regulator with XRE-family HTH domain
MLKTEVNYAGGTSAYAFEPMEEMGSRIKFLRNSRDLTLDALGKIVGVSGQAVHQWESGSTANLKLENFLKFCAFFGVEPYWLAFGDEWKEKLGLSRAPGGIPKS